MFFDAIVIGLGAMGSAALYQLAKKGKKVLGIDQFSPPHDKGSSHGETRVIRQAIGEGEEYMPLILRAYELWHEIEKESNTNLLSICGGLFLIRQTPYFTNGKNTFLQHTLGIAKKYNISHAMLTTGEIKKKYPQFNLFGDEIAYFERNAGFLCPEKCIETYLFQAEKHGAQVNRNEKVLTFLYKENSVIIKTDKEKYSAKKIIISVGPWIKQFLPGYQKCFQIIRQNMYWFKVSNVISYLPNNFPIFIWFYEDSDDYIFGFPTLNGIYEGIKLICQELYTVASPNNAVGNITNKNQQDIFAKYFSGRLKGLTNNCLRAESCIFTSTDNKKFIIDFHPRFPNVIIASPCSGHGFKYASAIGEIVAELAIEGKSKINISSFSLKRLWF